MNFSRPLALSIVIGATLVSLGFVAVSYSVDPSHMTHFFRYFWMVLYLLFTMAVMICADVAFQIATAGWSPPSRVGRYSKLIGRWAISAVVLWLAFWYQNLLFLWIVFVLALVVPFWIGFNGSGVLVNEPNKLD